MAKKYFYITTPIYYLNNKPHVGHAYTTLAADVLARHLRAAGKDVYFQTGTDEHGSNIEKIAREKNIEPKTWCREISADFRNLWKTLNISYDYFIRTTDQDHERRVQAAFERLIETGDIYPGSYNGLYCPSCESFIDEGELIGGNCSVHGKPPERVSEDTYFFKLSKYQGPLLKHYAKNPDFLAPKHRAQEIINFAKSGLKDISVSRTKVAWGVKVPSNPAHTVYVWFDALLNYATGVGYHPQNPDPVFAEKWPADVHLVGKEIFRFHAVTWPAMLMALGLELPKKVYAHGWWTVNGEKMSKSKGNFINPDDIVRDYGLDAFRYFLFREVPFGSDGDFSHDSFKRRYNADLANDFGNLFSRTLNMVNIYLEGRLPGKPEAAALFNEFSERTAELDKKMKRLQFNEALDIIWQAVSVLNKKIDTEKPWEMAKKNPQALKPLLHDLIWCLRLIAGWVYPFMPDTSAKMQMQLAVGKANAAGEEPQKIPALFPRKQ